MRDGVRRETVYPEMPMAQDRFVAGPNVARSNRWVKGQGQRPRLDVLRQERWGGRAARARLLRMREAI